MNHYEAMKADREARERAENIKKLQPGGLFYGKYTVDGGVMRWTSNGCVPFDDMLEAAAAIGENVDFTASTEARARETAAALHKYAEARANMSEEQKAEEAFERRAAFGPGETVVDVITGERFTT